MTRTRKPAPPPAESPLRRALMKAVRDPDLDPAVKSWFKKLLRGDKPPRNGGAK